MYFQSICTIENKPRDRRPRIKNYPLGVSQKRVIPCPDQEIIHARVVHLKWAIPCYLGSSLTVKRFANKKKKAQLLTEKEM